MKKLTLVVAASFALLSFSVFAGGDCQYGHDAKIADATADKEPLDPKLLALQKEQEALQEQLIPKTTYN